MSPAVLARVTAKSLVLGDHLIIHKARLNGFQRHRVKDMDYPAVIASNDDSSVLGTVVYNVTEREMQYLDVFEGDEYERKEVEIQDLDTGRRVKANVYVWTAGVEKLDPQEWDFEDFVTMERWTREEKILVDGEVDSMGDRFWSGVESA